MSFLHSPRVLEGVELQGLVHYSFTLLYGFKGRLLTNFFDLVEQKVFCLELQGRQIFRHLEFQESHCACSRDRGPATANTSDKIYGNFLESANLIESLFWSCLAIFAYLSLTYRLKIQFIFRLHVSLNFAN